MLGVAQGGQKTQIGLQVVAAREQPERARCGVLNNGRRIGKPRKGGRRHVADRDRDHVSGTPAFAITHLTNRTGHVAR